VNLYGAMYCTRAVLPAMIEAKWGRIVTIVSDAGRTGDANGAAYAASKAGAAGLTRSIAAENGRHGVTANNIALGTMNPDDRAAVGRACGLAASQGDSAELCDPSAGNPDDAAALAALLASDHGSWVTGQTIPVNGGFSFAQ